MESVEATEQENNSVKINAKLAASKKRRQKANEWKQKFLENMTPEQLELKKAKDKEYNRQRRKKKKKSIKDLNDKKKENMRSMWRRHSKSYRQRQKKASRTCEKSVQCDLDSEMQLPSSPVVNTDGLTVGDAAFETNIAGSNVMFVYCVEPSPFYIL